MSYEYSTVAKLMKIAQKQICNSLYLKILINIFICQGVIPKNKAHLKSIT